MADEKKPSAADDQPTRVDSPSTPLPSPSSDPLLSVIPEDLTGDPLLSTLPRSQFADRSVPVIGEIPLLRKLGQGGMGAVYLGYKARLRQMVAVKVLPTHLAQLQPELTDRFLREAQLAASIESRHLVRVSDVDQKGGVSFIIMEYVNGPSASALLKEQFRESKRALDERDALDICIAAAEGLAAAHEAGVVHRDVKPDNILIPRARDGKSLRLADAKIADLGLARSAETGQALTATHMGMGTPGFMAPEQAMEARTAGKPADVFAMGATLYALLSGRGPFAGNSSTAVLMATIQQPHTPIREVDQHVSEATARLIDVCLAKDPANRFPDASALHAALRLCRDALGSDSAASIATARITDLQHADETGAKAASSQPPQAPPSIPSAASRRGRWILPAAAAIVVVVLALFLFAGLRGKGGGATDSAPTAAAPVRVGIACSGDKAKWLSWAAAEYRKTTPAPDAAIDLVTMSESEAAVAIERGDTKIVAWMPSSSMFPVRLAESWRARHGRSPFARSELISLSPQVFVFYQSRHDALRKRYGSIDFDTIRDAIAVGTWEKIASKPEWGSFTFAITDPSKYNNGLSSVVIMAAEHSGRAGKLGVSDIGSPAFHEWLLGFDSAFHVEGGSAGTMLDFVLKGPSAFDGVVTYEATALTLGPDAAERWEPVRIAYPRVNFWNDGRYYILDTPSVSEPQRKAAADFLEFLLGETAQKELVAHGFRPASPGIRLHDAGSPFVTGQSMGASLAVPIALDAPAAPVIDALLAAVRHD